MPEGTAAPARGTRLAATDLIAGGNLGAFLGIFSGADFEGATTA